MLVLTLVLARVEYLWMMFSALVQSLNLRDCPHTLDHNCHHDEDASVQCQTGTGYALSIAVYQLWE